MSFIPIDWEDANKATKVYIHHLEKKARKTLRFQDVMRQGCGGKHGIGQWSFHKLS
jgi:hypothetical protein